MRTVILKLDDLTPDAELGISRPWLNVIDWLESEGLYFSIGVIGNTLNALLPAFKGWIEKNKNKHFIEFWNHGYSHCRIEDNGEWKYEFQGVELRQQILSLEKTQALSARYFDKPFVTFGAPYNKMDCNSIRALTIFSELTHCFFASEDIDCDAQGIVDIPRGRVELESPCHFPNFDAFLESYRTSEGQKLLILQGHPNSWEVEQIAEFKDIVTFLSESGARFILPKDI